MFCVVCIPILSVIFYVYPWIESSEVTRVLLIDHRFLWIYPAFQFV